MLQVVARADRGEIGTRAAVKELAQIAREEKAVMSLVEAMRQDTNPAHFYWWDALTELGPDASPATPFLIERLKSEEDSRHAASVLGKIGPGAREAVPALCKTAVSTDRLLSPLLRWYSAESLGDIGVKSPEVIGVLRQVAQDEDVTARFAAKAALLKLGQDDGTLSFLVQQLGESKEEDRNAAILALHYLGPMAASAVPDLDALVQRESNPYVRDNAERAIASIKGK